MTEIHNSRRIPRFTVPQELVFPWKETLLRGTTGLPNAYLDSESDSLSGALMHQTLLPRCPLPTPDLHESLFSTIHLHSSPSSLKVAFSRRTKRVTMVESSDGTFLICSGGDASQSCSNSGGPIMVRSDVSRVRCRRLRLPVAQEAEAISRFIDTAYHERIHRLRVSLSIQGFRSQAG